jgi:predicted nucleic acid-binding Zn ribbon protein
MSRLIASWGLTASYEGWQIVRAWPDIVGPQIANRAIAEKFDEGILYVAVDKDIWRQELHMQREDILRKIHSLPYGRAIKELRLTGRRKG